MTLFDDLPSASVLYRHTMTERMRVLGLPPSDSVLRRHHAQWLDMLAGARSKAAPAAPVKTPATATAATVAAAPAAVAVPRVAAAPTAVAAPRVAPVPQVAPPASVAPAAASSSGGIFGWLKRLFGT